MAENTECVLRGMYLSGNLNTWNFSVSISGLNAVFLFSFFLFFYFNLLNKTP